VTVLAGNGAEARWAQFYQPSQPTPAFSDAQKYRVKLEYLILVSL